MRLVDTAAALAAIKHSGGVALTVGIDEMTFLEPVQIGEVVVLQGVRERRREDLDGVRRPGRGRGPAHGHHPSREQRVPGLRGGRRGGETPAGAPLCSRSPTTNDGGSGRRSSAGSAGSITRKRSTRRDRRSESTARAALSSLEPRRARALGKSFVGAWEDGRRRRPRIESQGLEGRTVRMTSELAGARTQLETADGTPRPLLAPVARRDGDRRCEPPAPHRQDPAREPPPARREPGTSRTTTCARSHDGPSRRRTWRSCRVAS